MRGVPLILHIASKCKQTRSKIKSKIIVDTRLSRIDLALFLQNQLRTVTRLIHHKCIYSVISYDLVKNARETLCSNVNHVEKLHSNYQLYRHIFINFLFLRSKYISSLAESRVEICNYTNVMFSMLRL